MIGLLAVVSFVGCTVVAEEEQSESTSAIVLDGNKGEKGKKPSLERAEEQSDKGPAVPDHKIIEEEN
jgi:hypothetical protein